MYYTGILPESNVDGFKFPKWVMLCNNCKPYADATSAFVVKKYPTTGAVQAVGLSAKSKIGLKLLFFAHNKLIPKFIVEKSCFSFKNNR